jgi:hypothetical protein
MGCRGEFRTHQVDVRRTTRALIGVLVAGLLWSCAGSSTGGGDGGTGPVTEGDFVQKAADAICGNLVGCCAAEGIPYDRAGCEAFVVAELELEPSPNKTWDSVEAGKCIDWFARIASSCHEAENNDGPCQHVYRGTLPEGAACEDSVECADIRGSVADCMFDDVTLAGTCGPVIEATRGRGGDACSRTCGIGNCYVFGADAGVPVCYLEDGLFCSSLGICVRAPVVGEPCDEFYCARGAYCSSEVICRALEPDGVPCESSEECAGRNCDDFVCGQGTIASTDLCSGR